MGSFAMDFTTTSRKPTLFKEASAVVEKWIPADKICSRISLFIVVTDDPPSSLVVGDSLVRSHVIYIWLPMKDVIPSGMLYTCIYVHITTGELYIVLAALALDQLT